MSMNELQSWLTTTEGIKPALDNLRAWSAAQSFGRSTLANKEFWEKHDWQKLLLAASIFSESDDRQLQEHALMIAQSALCFGDEIRLQDAGSLILTRLSNHRAVQLAESRKLLHPQLGSRVGMLEQLLWTKRRLAAEIVISENKSILGNSFQTDLWSKLSNFDWVSATAPTAAGKTFAILNWLLSQHANGTANSSVFVAPTRALVSEVEQQLNELKHEHGLSRLKITSLPINEVGLRDQPFISVFTQERLHIFLNAGEDPHQYDVTVVDEAQKLSDERRGVILQDAIERVSRANPKCKFVFLSPHSENPEVLLEEAPENRRTAVVPSNTPTVMQNLLIAEQVKGNTQSWTLSLSLEGQLLKLGGFELFDRPTTERKRLAFVAVALGKETTGTLVYVSTADGAEKVANLISEGLDIDGTELDSELADLSEFCRKMIHPKYQLVNLVKRGVAFHYGNMPSILRDEIERLFTIGKIRFLVSTSTLIEGVNIGCKTIIVRGPKKGVSTDMSPQDFWNLAGRAGRWGSDFYGNVVCVDVSKPKIWPNGVPVKTAYPIRRETDQVIGQFRELADYLSDREEMKTEKVDPKLEHVTAYLMSWQYREGSLSEAPPIKKITSELGQSLEELIKPALDGVQIKREIVDANPGISIVALQRLLTYFRGADGDAKNLLPIPPEDDDSVNKFVDIFDIINFTLAPVFAPEKRVLPCALTTWDWMRGMTLGRMIAARIQRESKNLIYQSEEELPYAKLIRETMANVENIARFLAPKYLGAYLSVLRQHFSEIGMQNEFPDELAYDLFLEFGVSSRTLLSLIGIGLSRTSSIELADFYGRTDMLETDVIERLSNREWETLDLPALVKREIQSVLEMKLLETAAKPI